MILRVPTKRRKIKCKAFKQRKYSQLSRMKKEREGEGEREKKQKDKKKTLSKMAERSSQITMTLIG